MITAEQAINMTATVSYEELCQKVEKAIEEAAKQGARSVTYILSDPEMTHKKRLCNELRNNGFLLPESEVSSFYLYIRW